MSLEILLIPLAIALTKEIAEALTENKHDNFMKIETRMKDQTLLELAIADWNCTFREIDTIDKLKPIGENEATFIKSEDGTFILVVNELAKKEDYEKWITDVEESYTHHLQQSVYMKLVTNAKERGLIIEKEVVLEDNSIELTYIIN
jgi:hypothetical protein